MQYSFSPPLTHMILYGFGSIHAKIQCFFTYIMSNSTNTAVMSNSSIMCKTGIISNAGIMSNSSSSGIMSSSRIMSNSSNTGSISNLYYISQIHGYTCVTDGNIVTTVTHDILLVMILPVT